MDHHSIQTASHYLNNLLLARGLLRNGAPIDFANPAQGEGGTGATMAKIMNVVHDMILRRDRESETLSSFAQTLSAVRSTSTRQAQTISKLEMKNIELERKLSLSNSQERSSMSGLKIAETRNRALRDDVNRLKSTITQVRAQCANDVRKRETEIARLKRYLENKRGRDANLQVGVTVVTPGLTKPRINVDQTAESAVANLDSPSYSLKEETTEFLTELSQSLSDENDAMISLVQNTLATLRELQGLTEKEAHRDGRVDLLGDVNISTYIPPSYKELTTSMDETLQHLKTLLTNPSFVPLEEVEIREEEILRLREGWEKMESRWREAIALMNSWRKRMMESGDTINLEDLRRGLNLDINDTIPPRAVARRSIASNDSNGSLGIAAELEQDDCQFEAEIIANDTSPIEEKVINVFHAPNVLKSTDGNSRLLPSAKDGNLEATPPKAQTLSEAWPDEDDIVLLDLVDVRRTSTSKRRKIDEYKESLTVQEKLEVAEREAEKAVEAARVKQESMKPVKRMAIARKNKSKRRSTLSPAELEGLMGIEETAVGSDYMA